MRGLVKLGCVPEGGVPAVEPPLEPPSSAARVRWKGVLAGVRALEGGLKSCRKHARRGFYHYFQHFLRAQVLRKDGVTTNTQDLYLQGGHSARHLGVHWVKATTFA